MKNCDQILSGQVGIGIGKSTGRRHHLHLQQIGGSQENGTNHNKENDKMSNCGTRGAYSLPDPSTLLCKNLAHSFFAISRTNISECRARDGE